MPWAAKRQCSGCGRATLGRYCERCRTRGNAREERGSAARRGYGWRWRKYREGYLAAHPLCGDPFKRHVGVVRAATDVDHVEPVSGPEDARFWDPANLQALCHACHSVKTAKRDGGFGRADMRGLGGGDARDGAGMG